MKTISSVMIAGLIMVAASYAYGETAGTCEASLDARISNIYMNAQGNVTRIVFSNGAVLEDPQIDPEDEALQGVDVSRVRGLPFQLLVVSDPDGPRMVVVSEPAVPIVAPSATETVLGLNAEGQIMGVKTPDVAAVPESGEPLAAEPDSVARSCCAYCPTGRCCGPCMCCSSLAGAPLEQPLSAVDLLGYRSYALVEYRDPSTGETKLGVLAAEVGAQAGEGVRGR